MGNNRYTYELIEFGKKIRSYRKKMNITQVDLELKSGINNGDISRIESGQKNIEFFTIVKLAEALEVELSDLFKKEKVK
jgi:transcriptional regulator with XRE-family HTH domain